MENESTCRDYFLATIHWADSTRNRTFPEDDILPWFLRNLKICILSVKNRKEKKGPETRRAVAYTVVYTVQTWDLYLVQYLY